MPLFESSCVSDGCLLSGKVFEWWAKNSEQPDPECECCHQPTERQVSRFGIVWTGPITGKYLDRNLEGGNGDGAHWAWRTKETRSGKPEACYIDSFQAQREYCKAEGLGLPQDTSDCMVTPDGKATVGISRGEAKDIREAGRHTPKQETESAVG